MSKEPEVSSERWVTRRSHLQVNKTEVLPVVFKSRKVQRAEQDTGPVPPAFPASEIYLPDCLDVIKSWLMTNIAKMQRVGAMNVKPGSLEAPEVLRTGKYRLTVWFEPTAASFALMLPKSSQSSSGRNEDNGRDVSHAQEYQGYTPTPQTLHVVGELDDDHENR